MKDISANGLHWANTDESVVPRVGISNSIDADSSAPTVDFASTYRFERTDSIVDLLTSGEYKLSVIIPLFNEVDNIDPLYSRLKRQLMISAPNHEIIFVDDGSHDDSFKKLVQYWRLDPWVVALKLRNNSGKSAALMAGFEHAKGDIVLMMDADLQDQPEEMPRLIAKMDEGYDLVTGWKKKRHDPLHKTWPSKLFNKTIANYFHIDIHDFNCGYKIMTIQAARSLRLYGDYHRFIPVLAANNGFRIAEQVVEHAPRVAGVSKYGAKRLITGMLDFWSSIVITRFRNKPLQFFGAVGLVLIILGLVAGIYLFSSYLTDHTAHDRPMWIIMAVLLLAGLQMNGIGLLAELMIGVQNRNEGLYQLSHCLRHKELIDIEIKPRSSATDEAVSPNVLDRTIDTARANA